MELDFKVDFDGQNAQQEGPIHEEVSEVSRQELQRRLLEESVQQEDVESRAVNADIREFRVRIFVTLVPAPACADHTFSGPDIIPAAPR